jgi:signal transduction histidine kinase
VSETPPRVARKWRPSLGLIIAAMLSFVLALPLMGVFFARIYENQLVRRTEAELIGQSAVLAAEVQRQVTILAVPDGQLGAAAPREDADQGPFRPIQPALDLTSPLLPTRPDGRTPPAPPDPAFVTLGAAMAPILEETTRVTLAGFRILDPRGVVVAGGGESGLSLADVEEVATALGGRFAAVIRARVSSHPAPPLYSLSRGTEIRVFTAMPVLVRGRVAGVIYASRTPSNVIKDLYEERRKVTLVVLSIAVLTLLVGFGFHRTISGPLRALLARTRAVAAGDRAAIRPLDHHGTMELAALTQGFLDMAHGLANRSDFIATFAAHVSHELKSPLTSIQGAAELLRDDEGGMEDAARRRFLDNILADTRRLTALVNRLRELAVAESGPVAGTVDPRSLAGSLRAAFPMLAVRMTGEIDRPCAMAGETMRIILSHLADNAARHGAKGLTIAISREGGMARIVVADDGAGISANNRARVFDSFFTTRREEGGTGMGLAIVRAMLASHGGSIDLLERPDSSGAAFVLLVPLADLA